MNINNTIDETFPVWQDDKVVWLSEKVNPDNDKEDLLDNPENAYETFFPSSELVKPEDVSKLDWKNHLFALHSIVYELCSMGSKQETCLLEILIPAIKKFRAENQLAKGKKIKHEELKASALNHKSQITTSYSLQCSMSRL